MMPLCGHRAMTGTVRQEPLFSHQTGHPDAAHHECPVHGVPHAHVDGHTRSDWPGKPPSLSRQAGHLPGCADSSDASARGSLHSPTRRASRHPQADWILSPMLFAELLSHSWCCEKMARAFLKISRSISRSLSLPFESAQFLLPSRSDAHCLGRLQDRVQSAPCAIEGSRCRRCPARGRLG